MQTILLLILSNTFMTTAWYWHLRGGAAVAEARPLPMVIAVSWGLALFEYCLAVPANRIGYGTFSGQQLKVMQEVITLAVFAVFSVAFLGETLRWNFLAAGACLIAAVIFIFLPVE